MSIPQFQTRKSSSTSKSSSTNSKGAETRSSTFEIISPDKLLSLFEQGKGTQYFIPEGFEPVLIPTSTNGTQVQSANISLVNGKSSSSSNHGTRKGSQPQLLLQAQQQQHQQLLLQYQQQLQLQQQHAQQQQQQLFDQDANAATSSICQSDVKFPSMVLTRATGPAPRGGSVSKAAKPKKPPRPPNAFILYRRSKQPTIVAANEGITNNEVSKQVGEMWHKEPLDEKLKFQAMAEAAKLEHMKKYPEYKYRPRRPHEKRRRTKRPSISSSSVNSKAAASASNTATNTTITTPVQMTESGFPSSLFENTLNFDNVQVSRRPSIESTVSSIEESNLLDCSYEDFSRRGSLASIDIDNDMSVMFDVASSISLSPSLASAQVAGVSLDPIPSDSVWPGTAFDQFNLSSAMMEDVTPSPESEVTSFDFLSLDYAAYPADPFDYLNFNNFDYASLVSPNEQLMCQQPLSANNIDAQS